MTIPQILTWIAIVAIFGFVARPSLNRLAQWAPIRIPKARKMRKQ
jgi:hypothetical protein